MAGRQDIEVTESSQATISDNAIVSGIMLLVSGI